MFRGASSAAAQAERECARTPEGPTFPKLRLKACKRVVYAIVRRLSTLNENGIDRGRRVPAKKICVASVHQVALRAAAEEGLDIIVP